MISKSYKEYKLNIGDAKFTFFMDAGSVFENMTATAPVHSHTFYELFYVTKGEVIINNISLSENTAALLPCEYTHNSKIYENSQRIVVSFNIEKSKNKSSKKYYELFSKIQKEMLIIKDFDVGEVFKRLARYYYGTYTEKQELIISCLHEIILLITESFNTNKPSDSTNELSDSDMYRNYVTEQYMQKNFADCNINELAQILHLSTKQTQRIIKNLYSHTFSEYILILKMQYAKELLKECDLPVWKIAEKTGYKSPHNFYAAFKKHFGTSPHRFRKNL